LLQNILKLKAIGFNHKTIALTLGGLAWLLALTAKSYSLK